MSWWVQLIACFVAAICFALLMSQPRGTIAVSSLIATAGYAVFLLLRQSTMAYFCATLLIGVSCEVCARIMKKAATLFITSAIIPLVPGVGLYRTMRYVVEGAYEQAVNIGASTLLGICAIALALTVASFFFSNLRRNIKKAPPC